MGTSDAPQERFDRALDRLRKGGWRVTTDPDEQASPRVLLPVDLHATFADAGAASPDPGFEWWGDAATLQMIFASEGLVVRVSPSGTQPSATGREAGVDSENEAEEDEWGDGDAEDAWPSNSGTAVCLTTRGDDSDLCRIDQAFDRLRVLGYVAEGAFGWTASSGWGDISPGPDGETRAVFWTSQAHEDSFDDEGDLVSVLNLQWDGDPQVIAAALAGTGLAVTVPRGTHGTFVLAPYRPEPRTALALHAHVTRHDVEQMADELDWVLLESGGDDSGHRYESIWALAQDVEDSDEVEQEGEEPTVVRTVIRYVEDATVPLSHLVVHGPEDAEVAEDIADVCDVWSLWDALDAWRDARGRDEKLIALQATSLGAVGTPQAGKHAMPLYRESAADTDPEVRRAVVDAAEQLRWASLVEIVTALSDNDPDMEVRARARTVLAGF